MGDAEVGHDPGLVLLVAELAQRCGRLLEEPDGPTVVAGMAQREREIRLRQGDTAPVAEPAQDLEGLAVRLDGLVVAAVPAQLRTDRVETDRLAFGVGRRESDRYRLSGSADTARDADAEPGCAAGE